MEPKLPLAIAKYCELRDRRTQLKREFEEADEKLKGLMGQLENWFKTQLDQVGGNNMQTPMGTIYKSHRDYVAVDNFDAFIEYVTENAAYNMFERRVSKSAVKEYMSPDAEGHYRNPPPPGVKLVTEEFIGVRKS